ncbi:MAG: TetR/AcrR family transcriptional regulator [Longimicrobiales bacterium]
MRRTHPAPSQPDVPRNRTREPRERPAPGKSDSNRGGRMPRLTPERAEARRQQILAAAARCFSDRGFHATTMRTICREAGLSAGAVYTWFPSKEAIIEALGQLGLERHRRAEAAIHNGSDPRAAIDAYLASQQAVIDDPARVSIQAHLLSEAARGTDAGETLRRSVDEGAELLGGAMRALAPEDPGAHDRARLLQAVALGSMVQKVLQPELPSASLSLAERLLVGRDGRNGHESHEVRSRREDEDGRESAASFSARQDLR